MFNENLTFTCHLPSSMPFPIKEQYVNLEVNPSCLLWSESLAKRPTLVICFPIIKATGLKRASKLQSIYRGTEGSVSALAASKPQSTYRCRVEKGGVYLPLSWSVHRNFVYDVRYSERGWACTPNPHQLGLIFPS